MLGMRKLVAVALRRLTEHPVKARGEGADALPTDGEADPGNGPIRTAQQRGGSFQPPSQQVLVWRLAERLPEPPAEVGGRQAGDPGHVGHGQALKVTRVHQVFRAEQMAGYRHGGHGHSLPDSERTHSWSDAGHGPVISSSLSGKVRPSAEPATGSASCYGGYGARYRFPRQ